MHMITGPSQVKGAAPMLPRNDGGSHSSTQASPPLPLPPGDIPAASGDGAGPPQCMSPRGRSTADKFMDVCERQPFWGGAILEPGPHGQLWPPAAGILSAGRARCDSGRDPLVAPGAATG